MEIGRNEPCDCGSGKKYKRCCGAPKSDPLELAAGAIRATQDAAEAKIIRLIRDELGDDGFGEAWIEFDLTEGGLELKRDESDLFGSWVFYDWKPWEEDRHERRSGELRFTPAARCISGRGVSLSPKESDILIRTALTPTSFHEVIATDSQRTTTLRDIFLGTEVTVFEKLGSTQIRPGELLYGRAVDFDSVGLLIGAGQFVIPPAVKSIVLDAKSAIRRRPGKLTALKLCREELLLRSIYFQIRHNIVGPSRPELHNTDGDPFELHLLSYAITNLGAAIAGLAPLSGSSHEQLFAKANRARPGGSKRVTFSWIRAGKVMHDGMSNMVLAEFRINDSMLVVEVNSSKRVKLVKSEIDKRLGDHVTFIRDRRLPLAESLAAPTTERDSRRERVARKRDEELQALPEVQALLAKMTADHYAAWADVPLPALKGKTPRAAMKSKDGRERVEALITDFEISQNRSDVTMPHYDFNQLREMLGLPLRNA